MDFGPCLKAHNSVTIHLNITKLGKVTNFNVTLLVMCCHIFQYEEICNSTQSPAQPPGKRPSYRLYQIRST